MMNVNQTAARLILCADDFALTDKVSRGILALLERGRLTATGAMTNRPGWQGWARQLKAFATVADCGLHLNLTCGQPLGIMPALARGGTFPSLGRVLMAGLTSADARRDIAAEVTRQLDAFEQAFGAAPAFVDGHQHVHVLPGVRGAVLRAIAARYARGSVYLRDPADRATTIRSRGGPVGKALVVSRLAAGLTTAAHQHGVLTNDSFAGFSDFAPDTDFAAELASAFKSPGLRHLVMVHPGEADDHELIGLDPVIASRPKEFSVLAGERLPDLMAQAGLTLSRFA